MNKSFDLTMAFDNAEYLNPQIYLMVDSLKDNLPEDTIIHIVTNRSEGDKVLEYIKNNLNVKIYKEPVPENLKSRCKYMLNCFKINSDKEWVIKIECDMLALNTFENFKKVINDNYDIIIEQERRKIIKDDVLEQRIWRNIYRKLNITCPTDTFKTTEDITPMHPLFGTGVVFIKNEIIPLINKKWIDYTRICEGWIEFNIHPNEFAFTSIIYENKLKFGFFDPKIYDFNPISYFRDGPFPSQKLIDNSKIPEEVVLFSYHRSWWLKQLLDYNPKLKTLVNKNKNNIPNDWWETDLNKFMERSKNV